MVSTVGSYNLIVHSEAIYPRLNELCSWVKTAKCGTYLRANTPYQELLLGHRGPNTVPNQRAVQGPLRSLLSQAIEGSVLAADYCEAYLLGLGLCFAQSNPGCDATIVDWAEMFQDCGDPTRADATRREAERCLDLASPISKRVLRLRISIRTFPFVMVDSELFGLPQALFEGGLRTFEISGDDLYVWTASPHTWEIILGADQQYRHQNGAMAALVPSWILDDQQYEQSLLHHQYPVSLLTGPYYVGDVGHNLDEFRYYLHDAAIHAPVWAYAPSEERHKIFRAGRFLVSLMKTLGNNISSLQNLFHAAEIMAETQYFRDEKNRLEFDQTFAQAVTRLVIAAEKDLEKLGRANRRFQAISELVDRFFTILPLYFGQCRVPLKDAEISLLRRATGRTERLRIVEDKALPVKTYPAPLMAELAERGARPLP